MKGNSYDLLAPYYDLLSNILGKTYRGSKRIFLDRLKNGDQVLYLGGGTGANLPEILESIGLDGKVYYLEASSKMIEKARRRIAPNQVSRIVFLHQSDFSKIPHNTYDVVFTQFFLDILPDHEIKKLFQALAQRTKPGTRWVFLDFFAIPERRWLIRLMISFFRWTTDNPRKDLPNYADHFSYYGWEIEGKELLKGGFIQAWLLKRGEGERDRRDLEMEEMEGRSDGSGLGTEEKEET